MFDPSPKSKDQQSVDFTFTFAEELINKTRNTRKIHLSIVMNTQCATDRDMNQMEMYSNEHHQQLKIMMSDFLNLQNPSVEVLRDIRDVVITSDTSRGCNWFRKIQMMGYTPEMFDPLLPN
jgi:hypothetical protein